MNLSRKNIRRAWVKKNGKIPEGYELHHIVPLWDGGKNTLENIVCVSWEEHRKLHFERYIKNGNVRDLMASKIGISDKEMRLMKCRLGGKRGGTKQKKLGIGIHSQTKEERKQYASMGGKKGAFTQSKWQSEFGKRGGPKNAGFVWLTNGEKNIKYSPKKQKEKNVEQFLLENPTFKRGRTENKKTCIFCGVTMNARAIGRFHNERCKNAKDKVN